MEQINFLADFYDDQWYLIQIPTIQQPVKPNNSDSNYEALYIEYMLNLILFSSYLNSLALIKVSKEFENHILSIVKDPIKSDLIVFTLDIDFQINPKTKIAELI